MPMYPSDQGAPQVLQMQAPEENIPYSFPSGGIDVACPFGGQRPKPIAPIVTGPAMIETVAIVGTPQGSGSMAKPVYHRTTPLGMNVRGYDPLQNRLRGGSRPGLKAYIPQVVGGIAGWIVQNVNSIVEVNPVPQTNSSGRVVTLVAVSQGNLVLGQQWGHRLDNGNE